MTLRCNDCEAVLNYKYEHGYLIFDCTCGNYSKYFGEGLPDWVQDTGQDDPGFTFGKSGRVLFVHEKDRVIDIVEIPRSEVQFAKARPL